MHKGDILDCLSCSESFIVKRTTQKYCSPVCRLKDNYVRNRNKQLNRGYQLKKRYNIEEQLYFELVEKQNNLCAICKQPETYQVKGKNIQPLSIDHDHSTGKIRGLLCRKCNMALGLFNDNILQLNKAIAYLKKSQKMLSG